MNQRQKDIKDKNTLEGLLYDEDEQRKKSGSSYEYADLYNKDPRLAALQHAKKMLEFTNSDNKIQYLISKELFSRKPLEERQKIKKNRRFLINKKFKLMSADQKKEYNLKKKNRIINKYGLEYYKEKSKNQYKKWYSNLSSEKLNIISEKRKFRYANLSKFKKEEYKTNKLIKFNNMTFEERRQLYYKYYNSRLNKINSMDLEKKNKYLNNLRKRKREYFKNLPENKKKYYHGLKTISRQLNNNNITESEYINKKKELYNQYFI
jgi:hypothetical protein